MEQCFVEWNSKQRFLLHWRAEYGMIFPKGGGAMQLRIRQRIFSWTDSYDVYDETGAAKYEGRGALFSLGHQIKISDLIDFIAKKLHTDRRMQLRRENINNTASDAEFAFTVDKIRTDISRFDQKINEIIHGK